MTQPPSLSSDSEHRIKFKIVELPQHRFSLSPTLLGYSGSPPVIDPVSDIDSLALDLVLDPFLNHTFIRSILAGGNPEALIGKKLIVGRWVKTGREQGKGSFAFLELNDGSCGVNLQVIINGNVFLLDQLTATGTYVLIEGKLKNPPEGTKQDVEMRAERLSMSGRSILGSTRCPRPGSRSNSSAILFIFVLALTRSSCLEGLVLCILMFHWQVLLKPLEFV